MIEHRLPESLDLRLEHLFEKIAFFTPQYDPWATRVAVEALV